MAHILSNLNNFHSLEVVDRVSETQLQVSEHLDWIIWQLKDWSVDRIVYEPRRPKGFSNLKSSQMSLLALSASFEYLY